ncbi:M15 family metallopeptidase [Chromatocurvus halotolerans]|uniref:LAS superfamily LD-carboxypeptidase LdcB n=1 Tax=Chromatocurvus halotolerans TaxID=1132028 RepID=A0A4R2KV74_9GAMM|nr:M15 family metallopeptidase [Chromatocurvus halotolerans]TCO75069.1 LAS superfamily LD-carboxypeptidase LdcB [Chromatocurvus halotolerans]
MTRGREKGVEHYGVSAPGLQAAADAAGGITDAQLTGRDDSHVRPTDARHAMHPLVASAFTALQTDARAAGFDLAVASSFRSFDRQALIWNGKLRGERPVHDDRGQLLDLSALTGADRIAAVLRFSALPGASRHHWGTDLDVFDAAALPAGDSVQLVPSEVRAGGCFDALHCWLDERMACGRSHGFFRPYAHDRGGVAPERWHLSFAPLSRHLEHRLTPALLQRAWQRVELAGRDEVERDLSGLLARYVAVSPDWAQGVIRRG